MKFHYGFCYIDIYLHNPQKPTPYRQVALLTDTGATYVIVLSKASPVGLVDKRHFWAI